ncbi:MAG TPA: hypothetical protein PK014_04155 [Thermoanaerobaculia bacterium]|nr:hypothetical protein [Thermoanaerobaculia bacterium]HUM29249.1 hypothetical protein [Thermoanaerobaculia bacterium]HXK67793.1 hypothetical protein [Thermoanaerobaculia bacterium]
MFCLSTPLLHAADNVPTDIKLAGTQQGEVASFASPDNCDNCHVGPSGQDPNLEPAHGWRGGMMANATRDALFWATLAVAEQDFYPAGLNPDPLETQRGGAGDLCIRCHSVNGWVNNRSTPTDGSSLTTGDVNGVECEFCHLLVNPDMNINISGTTEIQNAPFEAYDPDTGEGYNGAAQYVINGNGTRLGPYTVTNAKHAFLPSSFHRDARLCATCHDVSNPAVGDLAHNNGAMKPLGAGSFSGVPGAPVDGKASLNNPPYSYGIVERTYSEWVASTLDTLMVNDYPTLPADLRVSGGSLDIAYHRAYDARNNANYEDGVARYYSCQTCHMSAGTGVGCNKSGTPTRTDLPRHDQTGGGYWMPDVVQYMDTKGTLRMGGGLSQAQKDALNSGKVRAANMLKSAASLSASQDINDLVVRVTNLTAHKLISGYPEGRRMWINTRWFDNGNNLVREDGAYGTIGRTVNDLNGTPHEVESILDPSTTRIYEIEMGMDKEWAAQLVSLGWDTGTILSYNRLTDAATHTLGELAGEDPGIQYHTFHFVLNNVVVNDPRIPPYGFSYDDAYERNSIPVPADQFGVTAPFSGKTYNYFDDVRFPIPAGAVSADIRLQYQQTSWEYIQFLWLQNDGQSTFLADEGINMLDAWLNTGMCPPLEMAFTTISGLTSPSSSPPGETSHEEIRAEHLRASYNPATEEISVVYTPACDAVGHTVYWGDLAGISTYLYGGAVCSSDIDGEITFTSATMPPSFFFLIAGNNGTHDGSYGTNTSGQERPGADGLECDFINYDKDVLPSTCDAMRLAFGK